MSTHRRTWRKLEQRAVKHRRSEKDSKENRDRLERMIRAQVFDDAIFTTKTLQPPKDLDLFDQFTHPIVGSPVTFKKE